MAWEVRKRQNTYSQLEQCNLTALQSRRSQGFRGHATMRAVPCGLGDHLPGVHAHAVSILCVVARGCLHHLQRPTWAGRYQTYLTSTAMSPCNTAGTLPHVDFRICHWQSSQVPVPVRNRSIEKIPHPVAECRKSGSGRIDDYPTRLAQGGRSESAEPHARARRLIIMASLSKGRIVGLRGRQP
ncbi:hypothetical protein K431DRAFT_43807 [Polychaeton citri CBS 116435]|uniref:Uncharacterized protein n=1 Tax=Polychaeton citri CBS 116435 TaxID=1314669 RepID=A0A9P4URK6_9PEZI|nr:hypothetical protein K431DRAFT_43807 [Polychaeton citri CBS 116435]